MKVPFTQTRSMLIAALVGVSILALSIFIPQRLTGRVLDADAFLLTQYKSDFDRDTDIDFLDFTVFSSFYEEGR